MNSIIVHLSPIFRLTLRLVLPFTILLLTSCQMVRSAHSPSLNSYDAEFVLRMEIVEHAASFIGSKYKYTGTCPKSGFDCSGFTSYILSHYDIQLTHQSKSQAVEGKPIPVERTMPGDIVYFSRKGRIFHVALVETNTDKGITVIHSTTSRGVIRENITTSDYWRPKIAGARSVIDPRALAER